MTSARIAFLGMRCAFSHAPFEALLAAGFPIVGLIIPSARRPDARSRFAAAVRPVPPPPLPMLPGDVVGAAHARGIPVLEVARLDDPASLEALDALRPDVLCVACFPRLLPPAWLARPLLGALNIHPSLLPAYRGPEPLFWQFREGETRTGVSVHRIDAGADTGDLVAQAEVPFPDGITPVEVERLTAEAGARLLVEALGQPTITHTPQPIAGASYYPRPGASDLVVPTAWPARRAFNFLRGAANWGPFVVVSPQCRLIARTALRFAPAGSSTSLTSSAPNAIWVDFSPGAVELQLVPSA